MKREIEEEKRS